ncbi:sulfur carrier protein ThiS [Paenibacillus sp. 481]|uniref:sulfur carrier protein ThiS n=1 Tax=Paenibacillus sp. 481 TaxID=2835869 RepID=UPI001E30AD44|nr:sulfur carrier protein ThiS [Paenibacillus sp. 481]UHA73113.1 sulfur carrier protein ThiS [Paenibacillus sp. 481]
MQQLTINGKFMDIPEEVHTVQHLLEWLQMSNRIVIVEHNEQIVMKTEHVDKRIQHGDKIEIVHFVGGG